MKVKKRTCKEVNKLTHTLITETGKKYHTITNDNGCEFKSNKHLTSKVYFCEPLRPQQRGTVENTIGLIRQYINRRTDVSKWSRKKFKNIEEILNLRPRKVLDFKTPHEVYYNKNVALECLI